MVNGRYLTPMGRFICQIFCIIFTAFLFGPPMIASIKKALIEEDEQIVADGNRRGVLRKGEEHEIADTDEELPLDVQDKIRAEAYARAGEDDPDKHFRSTILSGDVAPDDETVVKGRRVFKANRFMDRKAKEAGANEQQVDGRRRDVLDEWINDMWIKSEQERPGWIKVDFVWQQV